MDFGTGFISDLAGGEISELVSKYGAKYVANGLKKLNMSDSFIKRVTGVDLNAKKTPVSTYANVDVKGVGKAATSADRAAGVRAAWKAELDLVNRTGEGSIHWTKAELKELKATGKVKGYEGHHINSVKDNPSMVRDPRNVKFVKGRKEHLAEHGGNFRNQTSGKLIDR